MKFPAGGVPSSSMNSRIAAFNGSSPGSNSPFGIDQEPASLFLKNGPPGGTSNTCSSLLRNRYMRSPALCLGIIPHHCRDYFAGYSSLLLTSLLLVTLSVAPPSKLMVGLRLSSHSSFKLLVFTSSAVVRPRCRPSP